MLRNMGKVKKIIFLVQVAVIVLCAGIWGGIQIENSRVQKQNSIDQGYKTEIAVVNLDEGAISNGSMVYYSKSLIDSLASNFSVVSMQVAEAGLANGTYGGMIVIPADLSKSVMSINSTNITTASLQYKINNKLPEAKYIAVFESISNIQKALSNSFRYVYIASILQTTHRGQQNASQVFLNDQQDLEELNKLRGINFMEGLKHEPLPEISVVFQEISISDFNTKVTGYCTLLSDEYKKLYQAAVDAYAADELAIYDQVTIIRGIVGDWTDEMKGYADKAIDDQQALQAYEQALIDYEQALKKYEEALKKYEQDLKDYEQDMEAYLNGQRPTAPDPVTPPGAYVSSIIAQPTLTFTQIDFETIKNKYIGDINTAFVILDEIILRHSSQTMYEDQPILDNIDRIVSDLNDYVARVVQEFNEKQQKNEATLNKGINDVKKYASDVYSNAMKQYSEDKARLTLALNNFYSRKYSTSQNNKELLSEFANMLPYSRNGELINQEFVNGVITPIELKGDPYREIGNDSGESRARIQTIIFIVVIVLLLIALILMFTSMKKKEKDRNKVLAYRD